MLPFRDCSGHGPALIPRDPNLEASVRGKALLIWSKQSTTLGKPGNYLMICHQDGIGNSNDGLV